MPAFTASEKSSGIVTLRLIQSWPEWVRRRVDYLTVDDVVTVQVRASLDFELPPHAHPTGTTVGGESIVFVPLALFDKQRMTRFSLRDETDRALSILIQPKVARIGAATMWAQAQLARVSAPHLNVPREMPAAIQAMLVDIAGQRRSDALKALERLIAADAREGDDEACAAWRRLMRHSPRFVALARKLAETYLLITPLKQDDARRGRLLKLSYETPRLQGGGRPGPFADSTPEGPFVSGVRARLRQLATVSSLMPYPVYVRTGVVGRSQCYHQEAEAPEGLQITGARLSIYSTSDDALLCPPDVVYGKLQRAHLHVAGVDGDAYGITQLLLRTRISNIARTAWLASGVTLVLLIAVALLAAFLPGSVTSVVALLLVPPAALSAYVARPSEPLVSNEVVFGLKMIAATSALCAFLAAGLAAVGKHCVTLVPPMSTVAQKLEAECETRPVALAAIIVLVVLSAAVFVILEVIRRRINTPPELQEFRELQQRTGWNPAGAKPSDAKR